MAELSSAENEQDTKANDNGSTHTTNPNPNGETKSEKIGKPNLVKCYKILKGLTYRGNNSWSTRFN